VSVGGVSDLNEQAVKAASGSCWGEQCWQFPGPECCRQIAAKAVLTAYHDSLRKQGIVLVDVRDAVNWLQGRAEQMHDSDTTYHMAVKDAAAYLLHEAGQGPLVRPAKSVLVEQPTKPLREVALLRAAIRRELTHGGIRDRIAQATTVLGAESKKGSPVYRAAERLDRDRDDFYERMVAALRSEQPTKPCEADELRSEVERLRSLLKRASNYCMDRHPLIEDIRAEYNRTGAATKPCEKCGGSGKDRRDPVCGDPKHRHSGKCELWARRCPDCNGSGTVPVVLVDRDALVAEIVEALSAQIYGQDGADFIKRRFAPKDER
jgi:hypothetical protein